MVWTEDDLKAKGYDRDGKPIKKPGPSLSNKPVRDVGDVVSKSDNQEALFIPYEVRSKKNSRQIVFERDKQGMLIYGKNNTPKVKSIRSKAVSTYITATKTYYVAFASRFREMVEGKEKPYRVEFLFIRSTKQRFDYNNIAQLVQDLMVKHGWIEDDDANNLIPVFAPYQLDRSNPGVYIRVL